MAYMHIGKDFFHQMCLGKLQVVSSTLKTMLETAWFTLGY